MAAGASWELPVQGGAGPATLQRETCKDPEENMPIEKLFPFHFLSDTRSPVSKALSTKMPAQREAGKGTSTLQD